MHCQHALTLDFKENYCRFCGTVYACRNISLETYPGEVLGIVGESGSGKSTLLKCLYFDQDISSGEGYLRGYEEGSINFFAASSQQKRFIRNHLLGMVYQNPYLGLRMKVSSLGNVAEKLIAAGSRNVDTMCTVATGLLEKVSLPVWRMKEAPVNFSGGMQQRVQIAKALSNNAPLLLLDEVTTGLDLSVQADVLDLIKHIQRTLQISMIVVSHDLAVVRMLADRTIVMQNGAIIEQGLTDQILEDPQHPYTQQLIHSMI
jgi:putative phosphonate transport system ATP-binding protein